MKLEIKDCCQVPVEDGEPSDPMEAITALWFQLRGYITATNKWFWIWEKENKKQRGHMDIDLIALNEKETVIVNVTQNLNDKIDRPTKNFDTKKLETHFMKVKYYLSKVDQYKWLIENRKVRYLLVYGVGRDPEELRELREHLLRSLRKEKIKIELVKFKKVLEETIKIIKENHTKNRRITNRMMKLLVEIINKGVKIPTG